MKVLFVCAVFASVFYLGWCEKCTTNSECASTSCATGSVVICQHPDGAGIQTDGGLCTCEQSSQGSCVFAADCYGANAPSLVCPDERRHCYDGKCICDRWGSAGAGR
ncbi:uncharacterized protein LOC128204383 [Mya arenaria]|uniref:uncharacterized protein LOC128204383 n=1 Tax=Mya arenaria TaxID=6604 RepID=UPI0022E2E9C0|nr:uncharacterized protein LOC128204383 [Mya arenaria]